MEAKLNTILKKLETLESLPQKIDSIDTKITKLSSRIDEIDARVNTQKNTIAEIQKVQTQDSNRINTNLVDIHELKGRADKYEKSAVFISEQYDEISPTVGEHTEAIKKIEKQHADLKEENVQIKKWYSDLKNELAQEKAGRNQDQQYVRTSVNLKLCGVPLQVGEEATVTPSNVVTTAVIKRVCDAADIHMESTAIDVCHRLSQEPRSPIIIRFISKSARFHFYNQRSKLKNIIDIDFSGLPLPDEESDETAVRSRGGISNRDTRGGRPHMTRSAARQLVTGASEIAENGEIEIYVQEHLTKYTKDLLKETKDKLKDRGFAYGGYVKHGEVRVKKLPADKYTVIRCPSEIQNLLDNDEG